ncbi:MAG: class I SAM-dependent methyltransferase [Candidatus Cloacimonetes bacterium]|jgi:SAM-dependent methyltransferase|nr:class I SAM-dependent methyltransferase [Candidatus Cloacimonadota bacterium]
MKEALSLLNQIEASRVLDAATGKGDFIQTLKQHLKSYGQIIGVDASEKSVDHAQKRFPENDVEIYRMDLGALAFEDASFDLVTLFNSLHHIAELDKALSEMMRVLKPGGRFLISEMYCDGQQSEPQKTHVMMHHWLAHIDRESGIYHRDTFKRDEIIAIFDGLGLAKLKSVDYYVPVDDPKAVLNCDNLKRNCSVAFSKAHNLEKYEEILSEGKMVLERINDVGCAGASRLMLLGQKPNINM